MASVLTEEIATNLEEVAEATRRIDPRMMGYFGGGIGVGIIVGFIFGYRFNREKIRAEAFAASKEEVEKIREHYQQKEKAVAARQKPSVEEVVEERGYSVKSEVEVEPERPVKPPVPVAPARPLRAGPPSNMVGWDYDAEVKARAEAEGEPYVIHQDERNEDPGYNTVVYTYYAVDDVVTDEDNRPLPHAQEIIGINNLKFGHGTDDDDVVFVRNEDLELEMEICRLHKSYEVEVLGLDGPGPEIEHSAHPNRKRKRRNNPMK